MVLKYKFIWLRGLLISGAQAWLLERVFFAVVVLRSVLFVT